MRILFALICSFALAFAASGAQEKKKEQKPAPKKQQQATQGVGARAVGPKTGGPHQQTSALQHTPGPQGGSGAKQGKAKGPQQPTGAAGQPSGTGAQKTKEKKGPQQTPTTAGQTAAGGAGAGKTKQAQVNAAQAKSKPIKPQHFNLPSKPKTAVAPPVKFQQNKRIEGSQKWQGSKYQVFRNYKSEWHDRNWWHSHFNRVVFVYGGWYAWNRGYWYPAWGYDTNSYYAYDAPIYAYNNLPPDQVIANVQSTLQQQGYYRGEVDGLLGPQTRAAVADYQRDHGLYTTSTIDEPTLQSLGMA